MTPELEPPDADPSQSRHGRTAHRRELQLAELFEQAPGFMAILSGRDHRFELANPGYLQLVGGRAVLGRTLAEALPDAVAQGYLQLLDHVFDTGEAVSDFGALYAVQIVPEGPIDARYLDFVLQPIRSDDGQVVSIFVQGTDVTERVTDEHRRGAMVRLSDAFRDARTMGELSFAAGETVGNSLKASRVGYGTIDPDTDTLFVERDWTASGVRSLEGETPLRQFGSYMDDWKVGETVCIHDVYEDPRTAAGAQALEALSARAFVGVPVLENGRLVAVVFVNSSHARRWTSAELAFIKEVADRARTAVERARSEAALADTAEHLKLMVLELKHRVKNSLAIVQSIAAQSLRGDVTLSQAREAFMQRVSALAVAHDIITRDQWEDLSLDEVARGVLEPLVGGSERLILAGPRFALKPTSGLALALAFHELGTNALKYGALSVPTGHVAIHWAAVAPNSRDVLIRWSEHNGPTVTPPTKQGFGTRLLTRALASELGGQVTLEYPQAGVVCTITGMIRVDEPLHT